MKLNVSHDTAQWYKEEMRLQKGDFVKFYTKLYGGIPTVFSNYFLGVTKGQAGEGVLEANVDGITFYFSEQDEWVLEEHELNVEIKNGEPEFTFTEVDE